MTGRVARGAATRKAAGELKSKVEPVQLSSPPATPSPAAGKKRKGSKPSKEGLPAPKSSHKRARTTAVKHEDNDGKPHNLGDVPSSKTNLGAGANESSKVKTKKSPRKAKDASVNKENVGDLVAKVTTTPDASPKKKKTKNTNYGLTPGQSPYPNWEHPTVEECHEVNRLLSSIHGEVKAPKTVPTPSLIVSGCGEVPSVLDALIRTRLSAATSGTNSSRAFAGLVSKFGVLKEGIGKGSVNWNKVRLADTKEIFEAIKCGGLADVKSKDIKQILQMVWQENQDRRAALVSSSDAPDSANEGAEERQSEVAKAEQDVVSLDHLHLLSNDDAFNALVKYPGIGPKTASCVLLFCLQRPSFAVDTHVFRLCTWLGWVPPPGDPAGLIPGAKGKFTGPTRNSTYAHLDVKIPDDLKYPLHYLFIKHGKTCPRCRAITGENSEGWDEGCVIDHLVQRTGARKGTGSSLVKKPKTRKKKARDKESEDESSAMGDLGSDSDEPSEFEG